MAAGCLYSPFLDLYSPTRFRVIDRPISIPIKKDRISFSGRKWSITSATARHMPPNGISHSFFMIIYGHT
jgi:hypothetical protein